MPVDILNHQLVPKHEILPFKEKRKVLKRFKIENEKLPKILASDPVVKTINAKPGDVLKITRKSSTAGESVYYRIVTES